MVVTHWTRRLGPALAATLAFVVLTVAPASADLPTPSQPGFRDVALTFDLPSPTAVEFAPGMDGRMFVALKSGVVLAYDRPKDPSPETVIDLSADVHDFWDRGLLGMALDPAFASNGYMYLLYARDALINGSSPRWGDGCPTPPDPTGDGCVISGRLVRVTVDSFSHASPTSQVTLLQDQWCQQYPSHSVGALEFGPDGMLYASAGEGANFNDIDFGQWGDHSGPTPVNPCNDPYFPADPEASEGGALRSQDVRTDGDEAGLDGAVIRIDPTTGAAAAGNPFASSPDAGKRFVIAFGLRNPFRFTFRPGTRDLWLGDVGWTKYEEIDKVVTDDAVVENFGWPCFEGPQRTPEYAGMDLCASLPDVSVTPPVVSYAHATVIDGCDGSTGAGSSISGMAF
jgi:glucose/arabinose dehydrogenase